MSEYIKREDALKQAITVTHYDGKLGGVCDHQYVRVEDIRAIPAADVEPVVRGKWIEREDHCECSVCSQPVNFYDANDRCPQCYAHMERSGSGETY